MDRSGPMRQFRRVLRAARDRWAAVDRWALWLQLGIAVLRRPPVLVYTVGKVGSTALGNAVEVTTGRPVINVHRVTPAGRRAAEAQRALQVLPRRGREDWKGAFAYAMFRARTGRRRGSWDVVTGVRDPMALQVSLFFQIGLEFGHFTEDEQHLGVEPNELGRRFSAFSSSLAGSDWFRDELRPTTGIDVYATDFPWAEGVQVIEQPPFRLLIVRREDLTEKGAKALGMFLDAPGSVALPSSNVGATKSYAALYRTFVDHVRLPKELLDRCYGEPFVHHFYSPSEIAAMRRRWDR